MTRSPGHQDKRLASGADVPHGVPAWISRELIEQTIRVWQPYYANPLTVDDALAIMLAAGRLIDALSRKGPP